MKKIFFIIPIILIVLLAFYLVLKNKNNSISSQQNQVVRTYSIDEVAKHGDATNCWLVIDSKVYDVTKFIPMHQGGDQILMGCGKDATDLFTNQSEHEGGEAQKMLSELQIGILAGS